MHNQKRVTVYLETKKGLEIDVHNTDAVELVVLDYVSQGYTENAIVPFAENDIEVFMSEVA